MPSYRDPWVWLAVSGVFLLLGLPEDTATALDAGILGGLLFLAIARS